MLDIKFKISKIFAVYVLTYQFLSHICFLNKFTTWIIVENKIIQYKNVGLDDVIAAVRHRIIWIFAFLMGVGVRNSTKFTQSCAIPS